MHIGKVEALGHTAQAGRQEPKQIPTDHHLNDRVLPDLGAWLQPDNAIDPTRFNW